MNSVLKKKALTAVLAAAFVFGIGGMATEPVSIHEHSHMFEPAVAHAASWPTAYWRCYWCGKTGSSVGSAHFGNGKEVRAREPNTRDEKCPHKHDEAGGRHMWVWVSGVPKVSDYTTYYYCRRCNELSGRCKPGDYPSHHKGCRLNNGGSHDWTPTGIVRTR